MEKEKRNDSFPSLDEETVATLKQEILPQLITQARLHHQTLRIWIIECAIAEVVTEIMLLLARLLGHTLPKFHIQIFATDREETRLTCTHHDIFERTILSLPQDQELANFYEAVGSEYRLHPSLRKLVIFGRHDLWHDPFFAHLDLIVCGFSLLDHSPERQQHFFAQVSNSLTRSGHIVFSRQDHTILAHSLYQPVKEGIPIYQYAHVKEEPDPSILTQQSMDTQKNPDLLVTAMNTLLHTPPVDADAIGEGRSEHKEASTSVPLALDVLLRFAPIGIVVIDHRYQMLSFNRAAYKLLMLQIHEERNQDFFHAISGLPYQEVRTAIDMVMWEGTSQTIEEVELTIAAGGNGRVLSLEICLIPTEVGTPSHLVLYFQDITMQTVQKRIQLQQAQTIQELSTANAHLMRKSSDLERSGEHLREVSGHLLTEYQHLVRQLEGVQEARRLLDEQVEQLLEEITVLTEQSDERQGC